MLSFKTFLFIIILFEIINKLYMMEKYDTMILIK